MREHRVGLTQIILFQSNTTVGRIEVNGHAGNNARPKRRRALVLIADAAAVCAVLGAEATGAYAFACRSSAAFSTWGSSFPRFSARRSIP